MINYSVYSKNKVLLSVIVILFWFAQYIYIPFQTPFLRLCNVTSSFIGIVIGAYGITQMLFRMPVGILADTADYHKLFIIIGTLSSGIASIIRIFTLNGAGFLIANLFSGFSSAMWISFMIMYTGFYNETHQQVGTSRVIMYNNIGILAGFIAGTLLYDRMGMGFICTLSAISAITGALLATKLKGNDKKNTLNKKHSNIKELIKIYKTKNLIVFSILALIQQGIQMTTTMSFTTGVLKNLGATSAMIGISSIIYMLSSVGSSAFASTKTCQKKGAFFWIPLVFIIISTYCVIIPIANSIPVILIVQILPGITTGILYSYLTAEAMKGVPKKKKSTAMGFYQAVYAIGMTVFPIICGNIADIHSVSTAYFILAALGILGAMISGWYFRFILKVGKTPTSINGE